jgi:hypothetical protein
MSRTTPEDTWNLPEVLFGHPRSSPPAADPSPWHDIFDQRRHQAMHTTRSIDVICLLQGVLIDRPLVK